MVTIVAIANTGNFEFVAVAHGDNLGSARYIAERKLLTAWDEHVRQTGADDSLMGQMIADGDVNFMSTSTSAAAWRDGSIIAV